MSFLLNAINDYTAANDNVGKSKLGNIEKNAIIYHVIQQTDNRTSIFNSETARFRDSMFKNQCLKNGVVTLASVIMPNHTHDIVMSESFDRICKTVRTVNRSVSVFVKKYRQQNKQPLMVRVFNTDPGYVAVKNRMQFFILLKYLYDNPAYLKQNNEFVPYSCFDSWIKGYYKPFDMYAIEKILSMTKEELINYCVAQDKDEFRKTAVKLYGNDSQQLSDSIFKLNPEVPWIN